MPPLRLRSPVLDFGYEAPNITATMMTIFLSLLCALAPVQGNPGLLPSSLEVTNLVPDGPAARAGVSVGDVLVSYDGRPIGSRAELEAAQAAVLSDSVAVSFRRGNKELSLALPRGKLGIYLTEWQPDLKPDPDAKLIRDVPNLGWDRMNTFMGALDAIEQKLGDKVGYAYLCGVSGAAFRTQFFDTWCPSSPDPTLGYDAGTATLKALGFDATWLHVSQDGKNEPQIRAAIRKSIDAGMPVLGIDMSGMPEWGIIIGYQKNGDELLCHTYYDKHKLFEVAQKFPFAVGILKRQGRAPDEDASIKRGFGIVAENLAATKYGQYYSGLTGLNKWIDRLQFDDFTKLDSAQLANVVQTNYWVFQRLISDRETGIEYLSMVALKMPKLAPKLSDLAALYQQEVAALDPITGELPSSESVRPGWQWPKVDRDKEIAALVCARVFEEQTLPTWKELAGRKR